MSGIRQATTIVSPPSPALQLLHYWWPLAMGLSLAVVVRRATGRDWDPDGLALLLGGIAAAYSLDRVSDAWSNRTPRLAGLLAAAGLGACVLCAVLMWRLPAPTRVIVPILAICCALYPSVKKRPLLKTAMVSIAWTWSAIALPFHDGSWAGWHSALLPVALPLTLLVAAGCVMCDLKDLDRDRHAGVASLPVLVGPLGACLVAAALALTGAGLAAQLHRPALTITGLCLALATTRPSLLSRDVVGPLIVDAILTLPGLLILTNVV